MDDGSEGRPKRRLDDVGKSIILYRTVSYDTVCCMIDDTV